MFHGAADVEVTGGIFCVGGHFLHCDSGHRRPKISTSWEYVFSRFIQCVQVLSSCSRPCGLLLLCLLSSAPRRVGEIPAWGQYGCVYPLLLFTSIVPLFPLVVFWALVPQEHRVVLTLQVWKPRWRCLAFTQCAAFPFAKTVCISLQHLF